jgi:hypothetical protein
MAAIAYPSATPMHRRPARHLVVVPHPGAGRTVRVDPAVYRRRRLAVLVLATCTVAVLILLLRAAAGALGGAPLTPSAPPAAGGLQPAAAVTYVVQPGDTYWSIARSLHPSEDVRSVVDRLVAQQHGAPLQAGAVIALP